MDSSAFNGDLNQWDVAKVTLMESSKSIRIVANDLTGRELVLLCDGRVQAEVLGWLCMKFEFAFIAGHGSLIRVLPPSYLALIVNELCLRFLPNLYAT